MHTVLADADVRRQIEANGLEPWPSTPEALARHMKEEIERWGRVIREAGVRRGG